MTSLFGRALGVAALSLLANAGLAQESTNLVATMTDCSVFTEEDPKECWGVSKPKETVNSRDGQPVSVRRGVIIRPDGPAADRSLSLTVSGSPDPSTTAPGGSSAKPLRRPRKEPIRSPPSSDSIEQVM